MTYKEKADSLYKNFIVDSVINKSQSVKCAIVAVDVITDLIGELVDQEISGIHTIYWKRVRQELENKIKNVVRFYKTDNLWVAELSSISTDETKKRYLEMSFSSETWLDVISLGTDEVKIQFDTYEFDGFSHKLFYVGDAPTHVDGTYLIYPDNHYVFIDDFVKSLFGNYPQVIYYKIAE